jgi:hypothetical protein
MLAIESNTYDVGTEKIMSMLAGEAQRNPAVCISHSQYVTESMPTSGFGWLTLNTDMDAVCETVPLAQFRCVKSVKEVTACVVYPIESESDIRAEDDLNILKLAEFFQGPSVEADFDLDARLVPPLMNKKQFRVSLKFIGKLPPRIKFDPERD